MQELQEQRNSFSSPQKQQVGNPYMNESLNISMISHREGGLDTTLDSIEPGKKKGWANDSLLNASM